MIEQNTRLTDWINQHFSLTDFTLQAMPGDASFRRYFRLRTRHQRYIAVDAPPETENNPAFVKIAEAFLQSDIMVPRVLQADLTQGLLLITDLGDEVFFRVVNKDNADFLYQKALEELGKIQQCQLKLPFFDAEFIQKELHFFQEWVVKTHLKLTLTPAKAKMLKKTFALLINTATEQPQCCMHRDYHSRNLMVIGGKHIGVLDFQDAMTGPVTYDIVSLLRDCYIDWPEEKVLALAMFFHDNYLKQLIPSTEQFLYWFDLMGMQRHLKASFIFARKWHRDGVSAYLKEIPRALRYVLSVSERYPALENFNDWVATDVAPAFPGTLDASSSLLR